MAKLSDFVIGFIIVMATSVVLISVAGDFTHEYGISTSNFLNDSSGGICSASNTINEINSIASLFGNATTDAGTYAPGQLNAPVGSNMVTATQSSGLITTLKLAVSPLTLTKAMITDLGCAIGLPPVLVTAFEVVFAISVLLLIAGLFYYRPI